MDEIVVARPKRSTLIIVLFLILVVAGPVLVFGPWLAKALVAAIGALVAWQVMTMKLSVTRDHVIVNNLMSHKRVSLDGAEVFEDSTRSPWLSDGGGKLDTEGRMVYVTDLSGNKLHVGVAPTYGERRKQIVEDLEKAIAAMQSSR